jgi:hypothetical protein
MPTRVELEPIKIKQADAETSGNNFRLSINNPSEIKQSRAV